MTTTPKQLQAWREEFEALIPVDIIEVKTQRDSKNPELYWNFPAQYEWLGYLRRCQETEQIMKLAKFGAMVLKHDQNEYFCVEEVGNFANNAGLTIRTVLNGSSSTSYAPNIEATIKELLK